MQRFDRRPPLQLWAPGRSSSGSRVVRLYRTLDWNHPRVCRQAGPRCEPDRSVPHHRIIVEGALTEVSHDDPSTAVTAHPMQQLKPERLGSVGSADLFHELSVPVEPHETGVPVAVNDDESAIVQDVHSGRSVERFRRHTKAAQSADGHDELAIGTELLDLLSIAIDRPEEALSIDDQRMRRHDESRL